MLKSVARFGSPCRSGRSIPTPPRSAAHVTLADELPDARLRRHRGAGRSCTRRLRDAAATGIPSALVVSEGFADTKTDEGRARQEEIVAIARDAGMAVAGPNCMGIASLAPLRRDHGRHPDAGGGRRHLTGLAERRLAECVAELSANRGIGLNYLISIGNQAVLDMADYIEFLADDPATRVIACIMEGAKDGRQFRAAVERATRIKPVVVLKLGRSDSGQARRWRIPARWRESTKRLPLCSGQRRGAGLTLDELVETAALLDLLRCRPGNRVCMLTVSGGATR